jgi:hypothetical protein
MIEIGETKFCLGPLWFWCFPFAVSAHASRLHCGWPRAYSRSRAAWAFLVNLILEQPKFGIAPYLHHNSSRRFLQQLTESRGICE